jgi:hypothetical protein
MMAIENHLENFNAPGSERKLDPESFNKTTSKIGKINFSELLSSMKNGDEVNLLSHFTEARTRTNFGYNSICLHRLKKDSGHFFLSGAFLSSPPYPETPNKMLLTLKKFEAWLIEDDRVMTRQDANDISSYTFTSFIDTRSIGHMHRNWISVHLIGSAPIVLASYLDLDHFAENNCCGMTKELAVNIASKARELMRGNEAFGIAPARSDDSDAEDASEHSDQPKM